MPQKRKKTSPISLFEIAAITLALVVALAVANWQFNTSTSSKAASKEVRNTAEFQAALASAQPGDTILINGTLTGSIKINKSGTATNRITIKGGAINGGSGRLVELRDSNYLVFDGVTFDATTADSAMYMLHSQNNTFINNTFKNAGGECIRLKIQSNSNSFLNNRIENCGRRGFNPPSSKNGEGIYIGTAPEQLSRNASEGYTADPDTTQLNLVKNNIIITNGNECVDIKESAQYNLVEHNNCSNQLDPDSGAFDSRGEHNIFRNNTAGGTVLGAGVRLGGDTSSNGIQNCVIENRLTAYGTVGAIKVMTSPQKALCGNTTFNNVYGSGNFKPDVAITAACTPTQISNCLAGKTYGSGYEGVEAPVPTVVPSPSPITSASPVIVPSPSLRPSPVIPSPSIYASPVSSVRPSASPAAKGELPVMSVAASSDDGNVAANVLDRNYDTRWSANGKGQWLSFDLGQPRKITDVSISFYRGDKRRARFDVETSDDSQTWRKLDSDRSSGKSTSMQKFNISDRTARYVRLVNQGNTENDWGSYKEVIWFGN